jgi:MFS family permease
MAHVHVEQQTTTVADPNRRLIVLTGSLFFLSGSAALLYQVAWQRELFAWYGVDLDSVSTIVSVFMLGLGFGAMVGGWLADRFAQRRILIFSLVELTLGLFGFFSLYIIDGVALIGTDSLLRLILLTFLVFIVPTCAMGSTLPLLVTELVEITGNVGFSTGTLYFINTLGAAVGALVGGLFLLSFYGLDGIVAIAAALNLSVSIAAYLSMSRRA